ncbi:unnamed protein product [Didymodactylos carnosus]|uniref:Uncharacterized protein n=1 Tax=Didymodactylos carnosus TaxID=1234261 RepID=A0A8S2EI26_9BILA|nr:unnamed protein product [Didymodactylos carnosus]CAF4037797.1 unnamed protein product [Didymodactylos carnosus]
MRWPKGVTKGSVIVGGNGGGGQSNQLTEYDFKLPQYLDHCKKHKQAKLSTEYNFSELAEALFESAHYRDYVEYDKTKVLRPIAASLSANLSDKGKNIKLIVVFNVTC